MSKNFSLALFALLAFILIGAVWFHTGSIMPPSGEDAIWFHAGLLTLLIGTFIIEYRFTRPNDVFVNCIIVFASTSTLTNPPHAAWWQALRWGSLFCAVVAMALAWDPGQEAKLGSSRFRSILYQIVTRLGRAEVIFSIVFVLALISYFDLNDPDSRMFAVIWGIFLILAHLDLPALGRVTFRPRRFRERKLLAVTHSFLAPSIVYCRKLNAERVREHQLVGFCRTSGTDCHCFGIVIGERFSATENRLVIALLNSTIADAQLNDRSIVVALTDADRDTLHSTIEQSQIESVGKIVGTVAKGTNISQVRFEVFGTPNIFAGSLLSVKSGNSSVFYQVFDGVIDEEQTLGDSTRAYVEGHAEQVGFWDSARGGFETHNWVARERSAVALIDQADPAPAFQLKQTEATVGTIPDSQYPVNIDLQELVLFHTGILGVTGSGKSFLTYSLVEQCAARGIKVVCIDPTGDYQRYVADAVLIRGENAFDAFLNSNAHLIGIVETAGGTRHPIEVTLWAAKKCLKWCQNNRQHDEILNPKAKILFVLEEAHLLVPEFNFNPDRTRQNQVSETSQIVLQARKFGLGFLVVSQRTANVVKSVLNQCNTIFSFQAFDETGFEFLRNYMGSFHVASLPNLKTRHGLLVGKASRSRRPIMVRFIEQTRTVLANPAPDMAAVAQAVAAPQEAVPAQDANDHPNIEPAGDQND